MLKVPKPKPNKDKLKIIERNTPELGLDISRIDNSVIETHRF